MSKNNIIGKKGEDLACQFIENNGYSVLERNWRFASKEIDIIASKDNIITFFEVKTRQYNTSIEDCISDAKSNNLIAGANHYIEQNQIEKEVSFDVIIVVINGNQTKIQHHKEAITPNF